MTDVGVHAERVFAGAEAGDIDKRGNVVGVDVPAALSRLPRRPMSTTAGIACAYEVRPRFRRCTGRLRSVRSSGAGTICTVTVTDRGGLQAQRRIDQTRAITVRLTGSRAPATDTGSVNDFGARASPRSPDRRFRRRPDRDVTVPTT